MPMTLGDFFTSAPHAQPVNPKPVTFTVVSKGDILPGGQRNPHGRPVRASVTAAFTFLGGDGAGRARIEARKALYDRYKGEIIDDIDLGLETTYRELWQVLHQWDAAEKKVGPRLFESADLARELIEPSEARRVYQAYLAYVKDEHPVAADDATFRGAEEGSR